MLLSHICLHPPISGCPSFGVYLLTSYRVKSYQRYLTRINSMRTFTSRVVVLLALFCLLAGWLLASPVGSIAGSVKDASGAYMAGARVTLTNTATNAKIETDTNQNGEFQFLQLAPSTYTLVVESKGFKRAISSAVVQVDQITHADFNLEVGDVSQSVQVE